MDILNNSPIKYSEKRLLERIEMNEIEVLLQSDFSRYLPTEIKDKLSRLIVDNNWN